MNNIGIVLAGIVIILCIMAVFSTIGFSILIDRIDRLDDVIRIIKKQTGNDK